MSTLQKIFLTVGVFLFSIAVISEGRVVYNPDENTLWIEDGKDVERGVGASDKYWSEGLEMEGTEKGLRIKSLPLKKNATGRRMYEKCATGRYLKLSPEYPYLVWEITGVNYGEGYRELTFSLPSSLSLFRFITHIYPGIFVVNPFLFQKDLNEKTYFWYNIYLRNTEVYFKYIKMVKKPEGLIEVDSPVLKDKPYVEKGDELTFRVVLENPCEDVTLTFYQSYMTLRVRINGMSTMQLKPEDKEQKVWSGRIKIFEIGKGRLAYTPGNFLIKATVLGGNINVPIWTANWFEIKP